MDMVRLNQIINSKIKLKEWRGFESYQQTFEHVSQMDREIF